MNIRKGKTNFPRTKLNNLYTLEIHIIPPKDKKEYANITKEKDDVWHKRLGHLDKKGLSILGLPISNKRCESCIQGKSTRRPFVYSKRESKERRSSTLRFVWTYSSNISKWRMLFLSFDR